MPVTVCSPTRERNLASSASKIWKVGALKTGRAGTRMALSKMAGRASAVDLLGVDTLRGSPSVAPFFRCLSSALHAVAVSSRSPAN